MNWSGVFAKMLTGLLVMSWSLTAQALSNIGTIGDSITQGVPYRSGPGYGCHHCGGYQPYLQTMLDNRDIGKPYIVYNWGVESETSAGGRDRIPALIDIDNPDIILFMEGTNDLYDVSPETVHTHVIQATNIILAGGKIPVIGTLLPDTRGNSNNSKRIPETNALIRSTIRSMNVSLADFYNADSFYGWASKMADGLHPNYAGYKLMANVWYEAMGEHVLPEVSFLPAVYSVILRD